jgi:uracil-DNA glycosylase
MTDQSPSLAREIDAALAWWHSAGVDCDFADDARAWLADPSVIAPNPAASPARASAAAEAPAKSSQPDNDFGPAQALRTDYWGDSPPQSLAEFQQWWLQSESLGQGGLYPRIAPRGVAGAKLMVVVPDPEANDESQLLSGPQGRLLANILAAMGLEPDECYLAAALPCHTPRADLEAMAQTGLDTVLARHIFLAAPQRLMVLGAGLGPMLTSVNLHSLRNTNHDAGKVPLMVSETLEAMLHMPRLKARFWRRWMEWSAMSAGGEE